MDLPLAPPRVRNLPRSAPVEEIVASDDARIAETVTGAVSLLLELWMLIPHVPRLDPAQRFEWTNRTIAEAREHRALASSEPPQRETQLA